MRDAIWRNEWPVYRVNLVDETARCLADLQSAATGGQRPSWEELTNMQQSNLADNVAGIFLAQDQALANLIERGLIV
ncbi:hypothetical protein E3O47_07630 [Cryobacterium sp. TMT2-17-1]|uniref:hypothetical protein n=1 Tax=Cryobacterium sp. TMT2-17-1 TaxID=1259248 RepID=UPI00106D06C5|nr:hypothetical protein [Cryobacterium sp. TMT2-17-1]TFC50869.1 hypothetical protein E3O47_07630 [Cryobacterium sp. TMT2-17-1]